MNVVKFYHRDTGKLRRVRTVQGRPAYSDCQHQPVAFTEKVMARAGYFRQRPKI